MNIIGLAGPAGSGKDTAAQLLSEFADDLPLCTSFAAPIKRAFNDFFPSLKGIYNNRELKEKPHPLLGGKSPRQVLQFLGTEWGRELISPDIWIYSLESRLVGIECNPLIISDVRFPNEANWILKNGGEVWQLKRSVTSPDNPTHKSEIPIPVDMVSRIVYNGGSIADLESTLRGLYESYLQERT